MYLWRPSGGRLHAVTPTPSLQLQKKGDNIFTIRQTGGMVLGFFNIHTSPGTVLLCPQRQRLLTTGRLSIQLQLNLLHVTPAVLTETTEPRTGPRAFSHVGLGYARGQGSVSVIPWLWNRLCYAPIRDAGGRGLGSKGVQGAKGFYSSRSLFSPECFS